MHVAQQHPRPVLAGVGDVLFRQLVPLRAAHGQGLVFETFVAGGEAGGVAGGVAGGMASGERGCYCPMHEQPRNNTRKA